MREPFFADAGLAVYQGDALAVLRELPADAFDAVVTSPPYADARGADYACVTPDEFAGWFEPILRELLRVLRPEGGFMLNLGRLFRGGEEHPYVDETIATARAVGWKRIDTLIWRKTNGHALGGPYLHNQHETVFWLARDAGAYRGYNAETRTPYTYESLRRFKRAPRFKVKGGGRIPTSQPHPLGAKPSSVFSCSTGQEKGNPHPAPMAPKLASHLVALSCVPGGTVLDPFAGSGNVLRAALETGRHAAGVELSSRFCELIRERLTHVPLVLEAS